MPERIFCDNHHELRGAVEGPEPVHEWFELTYDQYLVLPRSIMEAMPPEWQERMVACLEELEETFDVRPKEGRYWVRLKDDAGRFVHDPLMEYRRPDFKYIEGLRRRRPA